MVNDNYFLIKRYGELTMTISQEFIDQALENCDTQEDIFGANGLVKEFIKRVLQTALDAEMEQQLGYEKHKKASKTSSNSRNGYSKKTVKGDFGAVDVEIPRDREAAFDPQIVRKGQRRLEALDDRILSLYSRGMTTRDISSHLKEMYGVDASATLISAVTDRVQDDVITWQNRPLDTVYPIVYLDCLRINVRENKQIIKKSVYLALGVTMEGQKELLGIWSSENEGAKFWLNVLTELQNRGVQDIFIACVDGLKGFPEAIQTVFPKAKVQLCIVHVVRNSLKYVASKNMKEVATDLKKIYQSDTLQEAEEELENFSEKWDAVYPNISKSWLNNWEHIATFFDYPKDIRKAIYTTNAIESLNMTLRKSIKNHRAFPTEDAMLKVIYLAIERVSKKWTMPIRNWKQALNRFAIEFADRMPV